MKLCWVLCLVVLLNVFKISQSAHLRVKRDDPDVGQVDELRPANNAERLKIEEPLEGENSDQLQVVNKIKELLNNKIQESSSDGVNIDVSDLLATTELAEADTTLSPDVRVADLATTTTTTTTTTTETTTTTTTTTQPPPPPSAPAEEPQQPAADPGIFGRITQLLNSLNPFGGNFGFQPVVIG